jgi:hypothetical protein
LRITHDSAGFSAARQKTSHRFARASARMGLVGVWLLGSAIARRSLGLKCRPHVVFLSSTASAGMVLCGALRCR